jgi:hypothetical protein
VPAGHLGLAGMEARALRIRASFACRSVSGKGHDHRGRVPKSVLAPVAAEAGAQPAADASIRDR